MDYTSKLTHIYNRLDRLTEGFDKEPRIDEHHFLVRTELISENIEKFEMKQNERYLEAMQVLEYFKEQVQGERVRKDEEYQLYKIRQLEN